MTIKYVWFSWGRSAKADNNNNNNDDDDDDDDDDDEEEEGQNLYYKTSIKILFTINPLLQKKTILHIISEERKNCSFTNSKK